MEPIYDFYWSAAWREEEGKDCSLFQDILYRALRHSLQQKLERELRLPLVQNDHTWESLQQLIDESSVFLRCVNHYSELNEWTLGELAHWQATRQLHYLFSVHLVEDQLIDARQRGEANAHDFSLWRTWMREGVGHQRGILGSQGFRAAIDRLSLAMALAIDSQSYEDTSTQVRKPLRLFLSHVSQDKEVIRSLYMKLKNLGFQPWLDEVDLLPGQDWRVEIERAVRDADAVLVCCSHSSHSKEGVFQREIKYALDIVEELPEGRAFILPVRLDSCPVPLRLTRWQWVNLFAPDGLHRLIRGLQVVQPRQRY